MFDCIKVTLFLLTINHRHDGNSEGNLKKLISQIIKRCANELPKDKEVVLYEQLRPLIAGETTENLLRAMRFQAPADDEVQRVHEIFRSHGDTDLQVLVTVDNFDVVHGHIKRLNPELKKEKDNSSWIIDNVCILIINTMILYYSDETYINFTI